MTPASAGDTDRQGGNADPAAIDGLESLAITVAPRSQEILLRDVTVIEKYFYRTHPTHAQLIVLAADSKTWNSGRHEHQAQALPRSPGILRDYADYH